MDAILDGLHEEYGSFVMMYGRADTPFVSDIEGLLLIQEAYLRNSNKSSQPVLLLLTLHQVLTMIKITLEIVAAGETNMLEIVVEQAVEIEAEVVDQSLLVKSVTNMVTMLVGTGSMRTTFDLHHLCRMIRLLLQILLNEPTLVFSHKIRKFI